MATAWTLLLLAVAPLPFGSARPLAASILACMAAVLLLLVIPLTRETLRSTGLRQLRGTLIPATVLFALVLGWGLLQTCPWLPTTWNHPLWAEAGMALGRDLPASISIDPALGLMSVMRLLTYAAYFTAVLVLALDRDRAKQLVKGVAIISVGLAVYGLAAQHIPEQPMILWFEKWAYQKFVTATFVNHNSYATFAGLGLLAMIAVAIKTFGRIPMGHSSSSHLALSQWLNTHSGPVLWTCLGVVSILGAFLLSGSRAGFVCTAIGLAVFGLGLALNKRRQGWPMTLTLVVILGGLMLGYMVAGHGIEARLGLLNDDASERLAAYQIGWRAASASPWLGYGLGSFDGIFRLFRDDNVRTWFHHQHNDWLEMILDLGIPAAVALWTAVALIVLRVAQGVWHRRRDGIYSALALAATILVGLHSLVDFSLQIPAVTITWLTLLAVGLAQSPSSRHKT
ncbi:MAG: O-antigen ligase family protein [Alphaproteobacteria bacterium]|nr:MAG: O-antigen ligase family protein [Alphaproteobacteria bacterium]